MRHVVHVRSTFKPHRYQRESCRTYQRVTTFTYQRVMSTCDHVSSTIATFDHSCERHGFHLFFSVAYPIFHLIHILFKLLNFHDCASRLFRLVCSMSKRRQPSVSACMSKRRQPSVCKGREPSVSEPSKPFPSRGASQQGKAANPDVYFQSL